MTAIDSPLTASRTDRWTPAAAIVGGAAVILGAALPWLSVMAGLQTLTGLDGSNGRILAGGGLLAVAAGVAALRRPTPRARWTTGLLGFALLAFSAWLLLALLLTAQQLAADPFTLVEMGPGLFIATIGAAVVFSPLLRKPASRSDGEVVTSTRLGALTIVMATSSAFAGVVHVALGAAHVGGAQADAAPFIVLGAAQVVLAALVLRPGRRVLVAGAIVNAGALLVWSLATSGPLSGPLRVLHDGAHHAFGPVAAILVAEVVAVVCGVAAARRPPR